MEKLDISIIKSEKSKLDSIDFKNLVFGKESTDHILIADFKENKWTDCRIEPFHNLELSPFALCLHYGQTVFEGMKAFLTKDGDINIFRPVDHWKRFNKSLERMCMPTVSKELFVEGMTELLKLDYQWLSNSPMQILYIRPFMIATEPKLGVKVSNDYSFIISLTPMCSYFSKNLRVKVETDYVRAAPGGTGTAKCGGNYGGAFYPTHIANQNGFDQLIWTDSKEHLYIEESGMMNVMFIIDDILITPELNNCILNGITRDSLIVIAKDLGIKTETRRVSVSEIKEAFKNNKKIEMFGVGTVAVVSPIETINIDGTDFSTTINEDAKMFKLKKVLESIRTGQVPDNHQWNHIVNK